MRHGTTLRWQAYGALVSALSLLHYTVLSPLSPSDEGGFAWFRKRLHPALPGPAAVGRRIWIHAVSAGESKVAELLRTELMKLDPRLSVVLSSTTYSGFARVHRVAGEGHSFIMPLDTQAAQRAVFDTIRPDLLVLVESEYWPAQFAAAREAGVPVVVVNATLSERSFSRHRRFAAVARGTIQQAARIYPQDEATLSRYLALGVPRENLEVAGNLKLASVASRHPAAREPVVTFGNVHEAEIAALGPAIAALRQNRPDLRVNLVPRYPGKIADEQLRRHFGPDLRIVGEPEEAAGALVWINRMGVLAELYARSAIGVVCGTFAPIGGHDLAEPLSLGAASLYGPHVERQRALHAALQGPGVATQVDNASELPGAIGALLDDPAARDEKVARYTSISDAAAQRLSVIAATLIGMARTE